MKQKVLVVNVVISAIMLSSYTYMAAKDNTLTPSEIKTGWKLLFDGKSLNGWRAYQNKASNSWSVKEGILYCKGSSTDKSDMRADMITDKQYENFDLSVDWKISPQGNSGILYMVTEDFKAAYLSGPEYQIIDDLNFPQKLEDWQKTGANYAMDPAPTAAPNPVGQWNTTRIVVDKGHVQHWLNGKKLLDFRMWTDEWKKKKTEGKWKDAPGYGISKKGHIALQDHGSEAWFKNIKIKEL
jgi:hypothetical protein